MTAYEMRISDWSSDVCSSDLQLLRAGDIALAQLALAVGLLARQNLGGLGPPQGCLGAFDLDAERCGVDTIEHVACLDDAALFEDALDDESGDPRPHLGNVGRRDASRQLGRSEEHPSELTSLMLITSAT